MDFIAFSSVAVYPPSHTQLDSATPGKTQLKPPGLR